jgi:sulfur-oxidizing protein SoxZ
METGLRKDKKTGSVIPAHFIETVKVEVNGKLILDALLGPAVSKNPFIQCKFKGASSGDGMKITWTDNKGDSDSKDVKIG